MENTNTFLFIKRGAVLFFIGAVLAGVLVLFTACNSSPLVGRWEWDAARDFWNEYDLWDEDEMNEEDNWVAELIAEIVANVSIIYEYFANGTGVRVDNWEIDYRRTYFTWTTENGRLYLTENDHTTAFNYTIYGSTLTKIELAPPERIWGHSEWFYMTLRRIN